MIRMLVILIAFLSVVAVSTLGRGSNANAQTEDEARQPMLIQLRHPDRVVLNPTPWDPSVHPSNLLTGRIRVLVDGVECTSRALPPVENRAGIENTFTATIPLGTADQPEACRRADGEVTFINGRGFALYETMRFEAGTTASLINYAPLPYNGAHTGVGSTATNGSASEGTAWLKDEWPSAVALAVAAVAFGGWMTGVVRRRGVNRQP